MEAVLPNFYKTFIFLWENLGMHYDLDLGFDIEGHFSINSYIRRLLIGCMFKMFHIWVWKHIFQCLAWQYTIYKASHWSLLRSMHESKYNCNNNTQYTDGGLAVSQPSCYFDCRKTLPVKCLGKIFMPILILKEKNLCTSIAWKIIK